MWMSTRSLRDAMVSVRVDEREEMVVLSNAQNCLLAGGADGEKDLVSWRKIDGMSDRVR